MLERYIYSNENGEAIEFSNAGVYHTNQVSGANDMRNTLYSITSMGQDGDTLVAVRIDSRDIEIIGSIAERDKERSFALRRALYRVMNPKLKASLTYIFGERVRVIDCVPDNAPIFSRQAIFQDFTIQLHCPYPFWRDVHETINEIALWVGAFEFPVEIPIETGMEFGFRAPSLIVDVENVGDVACGMRVDFRALGTVVNPSLLNVETREFIKINTTMQPGDTILVTTGYGQKSVKLIRGGVETDAFQFLDLESTYMQLDVGDNFLRYDAQSGIDNLEVTIYHNNDYLGV